MNEMQSAVRAAYARQRAESAPPARKACLEAPSAAQPGVLFALYDDLGAVEPLWRGFEPAADCTVFQNFDYLSAWQRHIGARERVRPAIVAVWRDNRLLALLPLALGENGLIRRLIWLGQDLCDYLAPLLAPDFPSEIDAAHFAALWREICALMQTDARFRHDLVDLRKMPEMVGGQRNPFLALPLSPNPSNAHLTRLFGDWERFYAEKRSASTRRRDRTKRKRLAESGAVRMVTPSEDIEIGRTLETLIRQKSDALKRMGVGDLFARPGVREFYLDLATNPHTRDLVHVSRLEVGPIVASVNLGLQYRDRYHYVLASYDSGEISRFGPGAAHLRDLLQRAIEHGFREFDFTIGDERYKFEWSDTETRLFDYVAAATPRGWPYAVLLGALRHLKRTIKQTPALWNAVVRVRSATAALLYRPRW